MYGMNRILQKIGWAAIAVDGLIPTDAFMAVSYTHLRAHETVLDLVCRLLLEKKKTTEQYIEVLQNEIIAGLSRETLNTSVSRLIKTNKTIVQTQ